MALLRMADRHRKGISSIATWLAVEFEQHLNHVPHLVFISVAIASYGLFDLAGRITMYWQALPHGRNYYCTPRLAEFECRAHVVSNK